MTSSYLRSTRIDGALAFVFAHTHTHLNDIFVHQDTFSISSRPDGATARRVPWTFWSHDDATENRFAGVLQGFGVGFHSLLESGAKGDAAWCVFSMIGNSNVCFVWRHRQVWSSLRKGFKGFGFGGCIPQRWHTASEPTDSCKWPDDNDDKDNDDDDNARGMQFWSVLKTLKDVSMIG